MTTPSTLRFSVTLICEGGDPNAILDELKLNKSDFEPVRAVARTLESTNRETGIHQPITLSGRLSEAVRFSVTAVPVLADHRELSLQSGCVVAGGCASDVTIACAPTTEPDPCQTSSS